MRVVKVLIRMAAVAFLAASCAPGTDGIVIAGAGADESNPLAALGDAPIQVVLPETPPIELPDLSTVGRYDDLVQERLGTLQLRAVEGLEVVAPECETGDRLLAGDETTNLFVDDVVDGEFMFEIDPVSGATEYYREADDVRTRLTTAGDGSGVFVEESPIGRVSIQAAADGSGRYFAEHGGMTMSVEADAAGAGVFYHQQQDSLTTITVGRDNSGALFSEDGERLLTIDARTDGSGELYRKQGERVTTLRVRTDGSWELSDESPVTSLTVKVLADGSGNYRERGGEFGPVSLNFMPDGSSSWRGEKGPAVIVPAAPTFVVADRFPPLGTLATIEPPCGINEEVPEPGTVLRFDSHVLFDVNEAIVLPEAAGVLAQVAPLLIEAGHPLEINGHTDANGTDAYNLELSQARAQAVADELRSLGVMVELTINGMGESQPIANNYNADGSDNEAGQQENRRVEIIVRG